MPHFSAFPEIMHLLILREDKNSFFSNVSLKHLCIFKEASLLTGFVVSLPVLQLSSVSCRVQHYWDQDNWSEVIWLSLHAHYPPSVPLTRKLTASSPLLHILLHQISYNKFTSFFFFLERVSYVPGWHWTHKTTKNDLEFLILIPPPPKCWDYKPAPACLVYAVLGRKSKASCLLVTQAFYQLSYISILSSL